MGSEHYYAALTEKKSSDDYLKESWLKLFLLCCYHCLFWGLLLCFALFQREVDVPCELVDEDDDD